HISAATPTPSDLARDAKLQAPAQPRLMAGILTGVVLAAAIAIALAVFFRREKQNNNVALSPTAPKDVTSASTQPSAATPLPRSTAVNITNSPPPQSVKEPANIAMVVPSTNPSLQVADVDRAAANWIISVGGTFFILHGGREFKTAADIPSTPFQI